LTSPTTSYPGQDEARSKLILILDHHKTAMGKICRDLKSSIDMERSGAMITWIIFFPNQEAPN